MLQHVFQTVDVQLPDRMSAAAIVAHGEQDRICNGQSAQGVRRHDVRDERFDASRPQRGTLVPVTRYGAHRNARRGPAIGDAKSKIAASKDQLLHRSPLYIGVENRESAT